MNFFWRCALFSYKTRCPLYILMLGIATVYLIYKLKKEHLDEQKEGPLYCITRNPAKPKTLVSGWRWFYGNRTAYLPGRKCEKIQKLITVYVEKVPDKRDKQLSRFYVTYKSISEIPKSHRIRDESAFFLGNKYVFEPENFFHFTNQVYFPLYQLIKRSNQLYEGAENVVFYPHVYGVCHDGSVFYHDVERYFYFNEILHVKNKLELSAYFDKPDPHEVCYRHATFSSEIFLENAKEAIDYFKSRAGVRDDVCNDNSMIILNRTANRRILNVDQLEDIGQSLGYDVKVVAMERQSLQEQAQLIHCAKVLVGVTGAGLQWAFFMKDNSKVVEIAWPKEHWPQFFNSINRYNSGERDVIRPLKFVTVTEVSCKANPEALNNYYEELFYVKGPFTKKESEMIVNDSRNYHFWTDTVSSLGKICDGVVNPEAFRTALNSIAS